MGEKMPTKYIIVASYLLLVIGLGYLSRKQVPKMTPEEYFVAGRRFGPLILLATMAATNFSGFTIFGASGMGYRQGYSFFPIMGFGTGFMAVMFVLIGRKVWRIGRERGHITPGEFVADIYAHKAVGTLFSIVMIVFTIPYIAIQPIAAGIALERLLGIPYVWGATMITVVVVGYTIMGGMRAIAWTDVLQGGLMIAGMVLALVVVSNVHGGLVSAQTIVWTLKPELFSRPGPHGIYTPSIWLSWMMLWMLCDPLFPQLFQRFYTARSERSIYATMICYPLFSSLIFVLPVMIGVLGHLTFPGLSAMQADNILALLLDRYGGVLVGPLVIAAGLAAIMSTMDSQLLTLSSIVVRDILPLKSIGQRWSRVSGRLMVIILAGAGLMLATNKFDTIFATATKYSFTGLAVLFPALWGGLYWRRAHAAGASASIVVGEALVVVSYAGWLPNLGFLPVIPIVGVATIVYVGVCMVARRTRPQCDEAPHTKVGGRHKILAFEFLAAIFVLSLDFWQWGRALPLVAGLPYWVWYFFGLALLLTFAMVYLARVYSMDDR